jgi:hypothetical protein
VFVAVVAVAFVVPVSLLVSMVRRVATRTVDCCLEQCATRRWWTGWRWETSSPGRRSGGVKLEGSRPCGSVASAGAASTKSGGPRTAGWARAR